MSNTNLTGVMVKFNKTLQKHPHRNTAAAVLGSVDFMEMDEYAPLRFAIVLLVVVMVITIFAILKHYT